MAKPLREEIARALCNGRGYDPDQMVYYSSDAQGNHEPIGKRWRLIGEKEIDAIVIAAAIDNVLDSAAECFAEEVRHVSGISDAASQQIMTDARDVLRDLLQRRMDANVCEHLS